MPRSSFSSSSMNFVEGGTDSAAGDLCNRAEPVIQQKALDIFRVLSHKIFL